MTERVDDTDHVLDLGEDSRVTGGRTGVVTTRKGLATRLLAGRATSPVAAV